MNLSSKKSHKMITSDDQHVSGIGISDGTPWRLPCQLHQAWSPTPRRQGQQRARGGKPCLIRIWSLKPLKMDFSQESVSIEIVRFRTLKSDQYIVYSIKLSVNISSKDMALQLPSFPSGSLIRGTIRVSSSKASMAFVRPDGAKSQDREWVVRGTKYRNRAVHGDIVIIQPILYGRTEDQGIELCWVLLSCVYISKLSRFFKWEDGKWSEDSSSEDEPVMATAIASDSDEEVVFTKPNVAGSAAVQRQEEEVKMAKVVAISEKKGQGRVLVCTLHPDRQKKGDGTVHPEDTFVKAVPTDKRLPSMLLQINHVTKKVLKLPGKLDPFQLWPMQILTWNEFSKQPLAKLQGQCLGRAGSLEAEEKHALIANELDDHDVDFPSDELDEVDDIVRDAKQNFLSEVKNRMDLRQIRIFTIDPATAKDLDDAIHVIDLPQKNQIEVGVHIADVAHFLKLGTVTDAEAQRRSTSVYLIGRVLPMLPHGLCNHLCSLNPNEPKLSFSAFFRLDKRSGNLIQDPAPWFAKTAMSSVCRLNYDQAQDVIDDIEIEETKRPAVHGGFTWQQIKDDIKLLYEVCGKVRMGRLTGGAMTISKTKMNSGFNLSRHSHFVFWMVFPGQKCW